jgi:UDP:flavonoid glycosyltransferase YjiC (YdhE family)
MRVLIASTPLTGHLTPLLAIGRILIAEGHQVMGLSANVMRDRITSTGAAFRAFPPGSDFDFSDRKSRFPDWQQIPPGPDRMRYTFERVYMDAIPAQSEGLRRALQEFPADVILGDNFLFGVLPLLLGPRSNRPAIVLSGTLLLFYHRDDGCAAFAGLPPPTNDVQREEFARISNEYDRLVYSPVQRYLNARLTTFGLGPLGMSWLDALVALPDAYLQLTVPEFEYPRSNLPGSVHFVGTPPLIAQQAPLPPWAHELDGSRKVVLVTQGTLSNFDFEQLIMPTLVALADEPDLLVVVTTGGRSLDAIRGAVPRNARLATFLPFEWLLPKIDVLVTNGGYGTVNQALSFGVPLVSAGLTEDKADVNTRIAWAGVGINLATQNPTPAALRGAVRSVLVNPEYRSRAAALAAEFVRIDTTSKIMRILAEVSRPVGR